jgi:p21-activated kinase 1
MDTHAEPVNSSSRRRLTKNKSKPPVSFNNLSKGHALRRNPSAPTYPSFHAGADAVPSPSQQLSPDPSNPTTHLRRQLSTSHISSPQPQSQSRTYSAASSQHSLRTTPELVGPPFDLASINQTITANIAAAKAASQAASRPALTHSQTSESASSKYLKSPLLRQSSSYSTFRKPMDTITPPRSDGGAGTNSPRQRWSGEGADASSKAKKKSTFSQFFKLGSPRRPTISTPTNPMHVTHVSIDNETGEFTVRDTSRPLHPFCTSLVLDVYSPLSLFPLSFSNTSIW